jgi:hypothetical protein
MKGNFVFELCLYNSVGVLYRHFFVGQLEREEKRDSRGYTIGYEDTEIEEFEEWILELLVCMASQKVEKCKNCNECMEVKVWAARDAWKLMRAMSKFVPKQE